MSHNSVADSHHDDRGERFSFGDIVGKSPRMNELFEKLPLVADSESPVLISGANGTGKELVAKEIHFPGNVRELWNLIERAFILCTGACIQPEHLPPQVCAAVSASPNPPAAAEREAIVRALRRHDGNRTRAARDLGIHRSTLLRKIRRFPRRFPDTFGQQDLRRLV